MDENRRRKEMADTVRTKEARRLRALRSGDKSVWFGLGMFGIVGWSVAVPTVILLALGIWIDRTWPSPYSWTLMFLFVGVVIGCANAWYWVNRERSMITALREEENDELSGDSHTG